MHFHPRCTMTDHLSQKPEREEYVSSPAALRKTLSRATHKPVPPRSTFPPLPRHEKSHTLSIDSGISNSRLPRPKKPVEGSSTSTAPAGRLTTRGGRYIELAGDPWPHALLAVPHIRSQEIRKGQQRIRNCSGTRLMARHTLSSPACAGTHRPEPPLFLGRPAMRFNSLAAAARTCGISVESGRGTQRQPLA